MNQAVIFFLGLFSLVAAHGQSSITIPPSTVDSLQIDAFMGRWFQMYTSLIPTKTFEKDLLCCVADFSQTAIPPKRLRAPQTPVTFDVTYSAK